MGVPRKKLSASVQGFFRDQEERDLDIPYHTVELPEMEEWGRRGFRTDPSI